MEIYGRLWKTSFPQVAHRFPQPLENVPRTPRFPHSPRFYRLLKSIKLKRKNEGKNLTKVIHSVKKEIPSVTIVGRWLTFAGLAGHFHRNTQICIVIVFKSYCYELFSVTCLCQFFSRKRKFYWVKTRLRSHYPLKTVYPSIW